MKNERYMTVTDYLLSIIQYRKLVVLNFIGIMIITFIISSLIPKWYLSTATILPPKKESGIMGLSNLAANLPFGGFDLLGGSGETMTYKAILESRSVMESVAKKFDLQTQYKAKNIESTIKELRKNVSVSIKKEEGTINVAVLDKNPIQAADMANTFIFYLDSLNTVLNIQKARNDRLFIEKRFHQNEAELAKAEEKLTQFQDKYGVISLPKQSESTIRNAAEIQAMIYATEVDLGVNEQNLTANHPYIVQTKNKIAELKKKLDEMDNGTADTMPITGEMNRNPSFMIPFSEIPGIGLTYARLFREVEVQNKLFGFLIQQFEQAKILEAKNTPTVQILDQAVPPIRKAKPKRLLIMMVAGLIGFLLSIAFVFSIEHFQWLKKSGDERYNKWLEIATTIRKDGKGIARNLGLRKKWN